MSNANHQPGKASQGSKQNPPIPGTPLREEHQKDLPHTSLDSDTQDDDQTQRNSESQAQEGSQPGLTGHINPDSGQSPLDE